MIWAYYIEVSRHMWHDGSVPEDGLYPSGNFGYNESNQFDLPTFEEIVKFLAQHKFNTVVLDLGDAIKWESHPEICAPNALDKAFFKQKLDELRAMGLTPIPKLNFSSCHDTWLKEYRRMVGSTIYRKVCRDLIEEAIELFDKPEYFHLGLDEETSEGCHMHSEAMVIRGEKLLWDDYHFFMDCCFNKGVRPWMWADYFWDRSELFVKNVSKEVLISNWYYHHFVHYKEEYWLSRAQDAFVNLAKYGYEQVPTFATFNGDHTTGYETMLHCKTNIDSKLIKGYMTASWLPTMPDEIYSHKNECYRLFRGRQLVYPETL